MGTMPTPKQYDGNVRLLGGLVSQWRPGEVNAMRDLQILEENIRHFQQPHIQKHEEMNSDMRGH